MAVRWLLLLQGGAEAGAPSVSRNVTGWHRRLNAANCTPTQTKESAQSNGVCKEGCPGPSTAAKPLILLSGKFICNADPIHFPAVTAAGEMLIKGDSGGLGGRGKDKPRRRLLGSQRKRAGLREAGPARGRKNGRSVPEDKLYGVFCEDIRKLC